MSKKVYVVQGARTPFAKAGTNLRAVHAAELGRFALAETFKKLDIPMRDIGLAVDEVVVGNTGTPSDAVNIARVVALQAGLPKSVSAYTVHRNCASALEAISQGFTKISAGEADVIVAGGTESMSQMPLIYNQKAVGFFEKLSRAKGVGAQIKTFKDIPVGAFLKPRIAIVEGLSDPFCGLNMGQTAEVVAKEFKISRQEQDQFALASHQKTVAAAKAGLFQGEISPFAVPPKYSEILSVDSGPRGEQSLEALGKLKPYFDRKFGTITVGNACPITDGATMTILASEEGLKKLGNPEPLAVIRGYAFAGLDPERMGLGPVYSTFKAMEKLKLTLSDFGIVELNEAFAAQVIGCLKAFDSDEFCQREFGRSKLGAIDPARLNPQGGAIAIGHPVGATGARLVLTLATQMKRNKVNLGLATLCIGGGQGGAMILEGI